MKKVPDGQESPPGGSTCAERDASDSKTGTAVGVELLLCGLEMFLHGLRSF